MTESPSAHHTPLTEQWKLDNLQTDAAVRRHLDSLPSTQDRDSSIHHTGDQAIMDPSDYPTDPAERDLYNWAVYGERVVLIEVEKDPTKVVRVCILIGTIINLVVISSPARKVLIRLDELGETATITTEDPLNQVRALDDPHMLRVGEAHLLCDRTICAKWFAEIYKDTPNEPDPRIVFESIGRALIHTRFDKPLRLAV